MQGGLSIAIPKNSLYNSTKYQNRYGVYVRKL